MRYTSNRRLKMAFRFQCKSAALTYPCPAGNIAGQECQHPLTAESLLAHLQKVPYYKVSVVATEHHKKDDGTPDLTRPHYHVWIEFTKMVNWRNLGKLTFAGCRPNVTKRKDGKKKYAKQDFLQYITKELEGDGGLLEDGIDVATYLETTKRKKASKVAYVANAIFEKPQTTTWDLCQDPELRSIVMQHKPKIEAFREFVRINGHRHAVLNRFSDEFINRMEHEGKDDHADFCTWWNFNMVEKSYAKEMRILYMWADAKSVQKSTLLKVVTHLANGDDKIQFDFHDKGWQEKCDANMRILAIDALQCGKQISFSLLEKLGDNSTVTLKKRNCKDGNTFKGPAIITSNVHPHALKTPDMHTWDTSVLDERMWVINFDEHPAAELVDELCRLHGLEPKRWMDSRKAPKQRARGRKRHLPPGFEHNGTQPLPKRNRLFLNQ